MLQVKFEGGIFTPTLLEKIREVINKRIQEKKKNEFTDLAPIDDIENGAEYLKALHWAIKKKKVKNIALAGPYGAGKSSIIDTYLKKHRIIRSKSLRVSMATFVENETDENGNPKKIPLKQDEIELGILKQLFYKSIIKDPAEQISEATQN
ncbi:MAG: TniB family NTP-binding protein [Thomasclavelia spiroformis]